MNTQKPDQTDDRIFGLIAAAVALGILFLVAVSPAQAAGLIVSWTDNSTNEASFELERKLGPEASGAQFALLITLGTNVTTYNDPSATEGTNFCYRVRASNPAGASAYSNVACKTVPFSVPAAPSNLVIP